MILYQRTNVELTKNTIFKFILLEDKYNINARFVYEIYSTEIYQE